MMLHRLHALQTNDTRMNCAQKPNEHTNTTAGCRYSLHSSQLDIWHRASRLPLPRINWVVPPSPSCVGFRFDCLDCKWMIGLLIDDLDDLDDLDDFFE